VEPNKWFQKPELNDHSCVVLDTRSGPAKVLYVYAKSPAANAEIKAGDELMGKDGQPLTSDQWHDLLCAAAGTVVSFRVAHEGKSRTISLTLGTYI
jgi:S1-C subfamily serine protease